MFTPTYKFENTRKYKRLRADYLIKYQVAGSSDEPFVANLKDISAGGLRFWSDHFIPEGMLLKVMVWVPPIDLHLDGLARIVRIRQGKNSSVYYMAVKFLEISSEDQQALNQFIEKLSTDPEAHAIVDGNEKVIRRAAREN